MKSPDVKNLRAKNGVSRLWLAVAAAAGAAIAYLGDRERGSARRQAALRQLSGAAQNAADRTSRWRKLVSTRLPGRAQDQAPAQVTVPNTPAVTATAPSGSKRPHRTSEVATDVQKPEL
jgi:Flp pilus assembly protein TadB